MNPAGSPIEVRAAGGIVWRPDPQGRPTVLLIHRPRYDDWSFPKGKARPGEGDLACALREVEEETGLRCAPGEELAEVVYNDRLGRRKRVRYWAMEPMEPLQGSFTPRREVDRVRWELPVDAARILTYGRDSEVVNWFSARLGGCSPRPQS